MRVSDADRQAVRLALLSAYVVEAGLPADMVHLLEALSATPQPRRLSMKRR